MSQLQRALAEPLSTAPTLTAPDHPPLQVLLFHGDKDERARMIAEDLVPGGFDVVVTSYEMVVREAGAFRKFAWRYLIVDEAHRMKNEESKLSQVSELVQHALS